MLALIDRFLPLQYRLMAGVGVFVGLLLALGVQSLRLAYAQSANAELREAYAIDKADHERAARAAIERNAVLRAEHAQQQQENIYVANIEKQARLAAQHDADQLRDRLRHTLRAVGAHSGIWPPFDAVTGRSAGGSAAACWRLLEQADELAQGLAGAAEQHAAEVRLLLGQVLADRAACEPVK